VVSGHIFESLVHPDEDLYLTINGVRQDPLKGQKMVYFDTSNEVDRFSELIYIFSHSEVAIESLGDVFLGNTFHWVVQTNFLAPRFLFGLNALVQSGIYGRY